MLAGFALVIKSSMARELFFRRHVCRNHLPVKQNHQIQRKNHNICVKEILKLVLSQAFRIMADLYRKDACSLIRGHAAAYHRIQAVCIPKNGISNFRIPVI